MANIIEAIDAGWFREMMEKMIEVRSIEVYLNNKKKPVIARRTLKRATWQSQK